MGGMTEICKFPLVGSPTSGFSVAKSHREVNNFRNFGHPSRKGRDDQVNNTRWWSRPPAGAANRKKTREKNRNYSISVIPPKKGGMTEMSNTPAGAMCHQRGSVNARWTLEAFREYTKTIFPKKKAWFDTSEKASRPKKWRKLFNFWQMRNDYVMPQRRTTLILYEILRQSTPTYICKNPKNVG